MASWLSNLFTSTGIFTGSSVASAPVFQPTIDPMQVRPIFVATQIISQAIASLPLKIKNNSKHHLNHVLNKRPNSILSPYNFKQAIAYNLICTGNAFVIINKVGENVTDFVLVDSSLVIIDYRNGQLIYKIRLVEYMPSQILHFRIFSRDGVNGISPIAANIDAINYYASVQNYAGNKFKKQEPGYLSYDGQQNLQPGQIDQITKTWKESLDGTNKLQKVPILSSGFRWSALASQSIDKDLINFQTNAIRGIASIFRIPPILLQDYSNKDGALQQDVSFLKHTLSPYLTAIEDEINLKLLSAKDEVVEFETWKILRGDTDSRQRLYQTLGTLGALSPNEIRDEIGLDPYPEGDDPFIQGAMVTVKNQRKEKNASITEQ